MIKYTSILVLLLFTNNLYANNVRADVIGVKVYEKDKRYRFAVTLKSDETGCNQSFLRT